MTVTMDAGTIAGLNVINEPTTAAVAYGRDKSPPNVTFLFTISEDLSMSPFWRNGVRAIAAETG